MTDAHQEFIERMGLLKEREGMPRIAGSLFALLILEEGPLSLDELAERLEVSKASVSTNARLLEQTGVAERIGRLGDRRDYYRLGPDACQRMFLAARRRMHDTRDLLKTTADALSKTSPTARARIAEMHRFYDFLIEELDATFERWEARSERAADEVEP